MLHPSAMLPVSLRSPRRARRLRGPGPSSPPAPSGPSGSGTNYRAAPKPVPPGCRRGCEAGSGARPGTGNREGAEGRLGAERRAAARSGVLGLDAVTRRRRAVRWLLAGDKMNKCIAL